jgi:hypothetical protein
VSNKITISHVAINFSTSSGYESSEVFCEGTSEPLKQGLREIARILAVNGEGDEAVRLVAEAKAAVEDFMKDRA